MIGPYDCYACGKRTRGTRPAMLTAVLFDDDGRRVPVGPDCLKHVRVAGAEGYQPWRGGPRLFFNESLRESWLARPKTPNVGVNAAGTAAPNVPEVDDL